VNKSIGEEGPGSLKAIPRPRTMKVVPLLTGFVSHTLLYVLVESRVEVARVGAGAAADR
jgi:hypothetical protein